MTKWVAWKRWDKKREQIDNKERRAFNVRVTSDANFFFRPCVWTVIPDYAKMSWSVRSDVWDTLEPLRERVVHCLECARDYPGHIFD